MSRRILVVLSSDSSWQPALMRAHGADPVFVSARFDGFEQLASDISAIGIIVCADALGLYPEVPRFDLPTVFLGGNGHPEARWEVQSDASVGAAIARAFADAGRTRIALVGPSITFGQERPEVLSFLKALGTYDLQLPRSLVVEIPDDRMYAAKLVGEALSSSLPMPQAIFCSSSASALGAHDIVTELGLEAPQELAIVSMADGPHFYLSDRNIISIVPNSEAMVEIALDRLLSTTRIGPSMGAQVPYRMISGKRMTQVTRALAGFIKPGDT